MREFTIYCLYDITNNYLFYVGATYRNVKERFKEHLYRKSSSSSKYITKINRNNIRYAILEKCDCLDDMYDGEYYWTEYYREFFTLYNLDSGRIHNKSFYDKMCGKNNVNYGKHLTEEQKENIIKKLTGRKIPKEIVEKIANANRGKKHSAEWCMHMSLGMRGKKRSMQYIKVRLVNTGEIFESVKSAGNKYGVADTHISACCRGKRMSAGKDCDGNKLVWQYVDNG